MRLPKLLSLILITSGLISNHAFAWGERGHHAIAQVAARLVAAQNEPDIAAFGALLQRKEFMLGHLANVPDIIWRAQGAEVDALNGPSHFIDLEFILPAGAPPLATELPNNLNSYLQALTSNCKNKSLACAAGDKDSDKISKAGHAPFRILELSEELRKTFLLLKTLEADPKAKPETRNALIDDALLYAGVLAHFVGDLANPHHTSEDYDGWKTEQGGLHKYFESELVDAMDLSLGATMFSRAHKEQPASKLRLSSKSQDNVLTMSWALALDSHKRLNTLLELDRKHARIKNSEKSKRQRATRKAPALVVIEFQELLLERLSLGADSLATIWIMNWQQGGKPKFDNYQSYNYPAQPKFMTPSYLQSLNKSSLKGE